MFNMLTEKNMYFFQNASRLESFFFPCHFNLTNNFSVG